MRSLPRVDRCLRKDPERRFASGDALAEALGPEQNADRELAVPLRAFIKQSREWETTLAWSAMGLLIVVPTAIVAIVGGGITGFVVGSLAVLAALVGFPVLTLARAVRALLKSGFTRADATVAFLRDIDQKEEVYRFQVGERETRVDRLYRAVELGGYAAAPFLLALGVITGVDAWFGATVASFGIGLEADRLFEALPQEARRTLGELPQTVQALEEDAKAMRKQVSEMDTILAEIGDDDPSLPAAAERVHFGERRGVGGLGRRRTHRPINPRAAPPSA